MRNHLSLRVSSRVSSFLARVLIASPFLLSPTFAAATEPDQAAWQALRDGAIVLFRHATAPGIGDPPRFRLGDCATQRNLDVAGRDEAVRIGVAVRAHRVPIGGVLSSQWCRTRETADLAFPGLAKEEPIFNSFFDNVADDPRQTAAARALLTAWKGPGTLVVVTHQVNVTALTGIYPASGEGVVLTSDGRALRVVGRIAPAR